jgi:hypothetical protein
VAADRSASAYDLSFNIVADVPKGSTYTINWDLTEKGVNQEVTGTLTLDATAGAIDQKASGKALVDSINAKSPGAASQDVVFPGKVLIGSDFPEITSRDNDTGDNTSFIQIDAEAGANPLHGVIRFKPDPISGIAHLTTAGNYTVSGPGLDASFTAAIGTTGDELAVLLSNAMSVPGFTTDVVGNSVFFSDSDPGTVSFAPSGNGIDYAIGIVPEPSTIPVHLIVIAAGVGHLWLRRKGRSA